jgi:hypothetical protein
MRIAKSFLHVIILLITASTVLGQRRSQIEFYAGSAFPLNPDDFKEYTKVGLSGNAQYVIFPSPRFGITFNVGYESFSTNNEKFVEAFSESQTGQKASYWASTVFTTQTGETVRINPSADIKSHLIRFGGGIRPYLTAPEANTQIFLLAQANYNLITNDFNATELPYAYDPDTNFLQWATFDDADWEKTIGENDDKVFGFGFGAGLEIPAGSSFNIVLQGLYNIVSTENEKTSFMGMTAGLVF